MKGIIFTEFIEMVESEFSAKILDTIIEGADLESGGSYTSIGTYPHEELLALVQQLSQQAKLPVTTLVRTFGHHLFKGFLAGYPQFFENTPSTFDFLESVEHHIHVEVRKLYPEAELPRFVCTRPKEGTFRMEYSSRRPFADLAHGLIEAALEHFAEPLELTREGDAQNGTGAVFLLQLKEAPNAS